jgi:hypothetical protein
MAESRVPLAQLITDLREELIEAQKRSSGKKAVLRLSSVELEAAVELHRVNGAKAKIEASFPTLAELKGEVHSELASKTISKIKLRV